MDLRCRVHVCGVEPTKNGASHVHITMSSTEWHRKLALRVSRCVVDRITIYPSSLWFAPAVLPLLSPEQELLSKGVKTRNKRLVPLRRRKSDIMGGGVRARATNSSNSSSSAWTPTSVGSESSLSKRRNSTPGFRSPDTSSRPSTTSSTNTARERASSGRISRCCDSATGLSADQGHLKVRIISSRMYSHFRIVNLTCCKLRST